MPDPAVNDPAAAAVKVKVEDTPEFKEALAREREQHRLNLEAEYRRKQQEWEASHQPADNSSSGSSNFFVDWGLKHGLPPDAGKELAEGVIGYVQQSVLPEVLRPLTQATKRSELRSQRADVRASNPKLARLDDRYNGEVMKLLEPMAPNLIGADSYARALQMVIGQHIEELEAEREKEGGKGQGREPEHVPGPEPLPSSGSSKLSKVVLNAVQQTFCDEKGFGADDFVSMMRDRARKLESNGLSKPQVRARLGDLLGSIEF